MITSITRLKDCTKTALKTKPTPNVEDIEICEEKTQSIVISLAFSHYSRLWRNSPQDKLEFVFRGIWIRALELAYRLNQGTTSAKSPDTLLNDMTLCHIALQVGSDSIVGQFCNRL